MTPQLYFSLGFVTFLMYICYLGMKRDVVDDNRFWTVLCIALSSIMAWPIVQTYWLGLMLGNIWRYVDEQGNGG